MPHQATSRPEQALFAEKPVVDSHHHFWGEGHPGAARFGRFLPEDFVAMAQASGHPVAATVYVDCGWAFRTEGPEHLRCVGETEYADAVAKRLGSTDEPVDRLCAGIVGRADLMLGDAVAEVLEAHVAASPEHFRGIRELVAYDPDAYQALNIAPGKLLDSRFRAGFARLAPMGLSCDLLCAHGMLEEVDDLARAFPDTVIILNHFAGPIGGGRFAGRRREVLADWRGKISALAQHPNISIKLSGVGADVMGFGWSEREAAPDSGIIAEAIAPYVHAAIDAFSPSRCMFGSNFPVDGQSFGYGAMWNAFKRTVATFPEAEQVEMLSATATRLYRLAA